MYILGQPGPDGGLRARRRRKREAASAPALYIDYESDRLAKENSVWLGGGVTETGSRERAEDEDKGC